MLRVRGKCGRLSLPGAMELDGAEGAFVRPRVRDVQLTFSLDLVQSPNEPSQINCSGPSSVVFTRAVSAGTAPLSYNGKQRGGAQRHRSLCSVRYHPFCR